MKDEIDFIGVGAVKSGSSWMASLLSQHPEVSMSKRKEVAFFNAYNFDGTINESSSYGKRYYLKFWPKTNKVKGEISPQYLFDTQSAERIKSTFPNIRILVMLRDPKQVVYSHYLYERFFNQSIDPSLSFIEALERHPFLLKSANFTEQLERYFKVFNRDNVHVYFLDQALKDQKEFSKQLYTSVKLNDVHFIPDYTSVNESKQVNSKFVNSLIKIPSFLKQKVEKSFRSDFLEKVKQSSLFIYMVKWRDYFLDKNVKRLHKPEMTSIDKKYLQTYFEHEIVNLEDLLEVDLTRWKTID